MKAKRLESMQSSRSAVPGGLADTSPCLNRSVYLVAPCPQCNRARRLQVPRPMAIPVQMFFEGETRC